MGLRMLRRHWITLLFAGAVAYFGIAAAPVLTELDAPRVVAAQ
jgi:hypothetical protein